MCLALKLRDLLASPRDILAEAEIKPGFRVLDYGCGPGSYLVPLAGLVGELGKIYTLDVHPLAIQKVQRLARKKRLANVETILSGCKTGLPDSSLDAVLLYDTFHHLSEPDEVLKELHRILRSGGVISFRDHHMKESEILSKMPAKLFRLLKKGRRTYTFVKIEAARTSFSVM